jgi:hypothetical protein
MLRTHCAATADSVAATVPQGPLDDGVHAVYPQLTRYGLPGEVYPSESAGALLFKLNLIVVAVSLTVAVMRRVQPG